MRHEEDVPMIPMTTQHLGTQPGRARLGASVRCRRHHQAMSHAHRGMCAQSWRPEALASMTLGVAATATVANGYVGTANPTGTGFRSIKRPARHLGSRTT
jgi:hypothetical protein